MWTVEIRDQTARSVQSDLDLNYPQTSCVVISLERVKAFITTSSICKGLF